MLIQLLLGGTALLGSAIAYGTLPWTMTGLAKRQVLVGFCKEGAVKSVMRGGGFSHQFMNWDGYHLNDPRKSWFDPNQPRWQVIKHDNQNDRRYDDRPWYMRTSGVHWMGWPPFSKAYWYKFAWHQMVPKRDGKYKIIDHIGNDEKGELTDFIYAKTVTYVHTIEKVEIADGFAVNITYIISVKIENAYLALFNGEDWLTATFGSADREARDFAGARHFQELLSERRDPSTPGEDPSNFSLPIVALTDRFRDDAPDAGECGLLARYGVRIVTADLVDFDPIGEDVLEANRLKYVKEQQAAGIEAVGKAEASVILMKGTEQAKVIGAVGNEEAKVIELKGIAAGKALKARVEALSNSGRIGELMLQTDALAAQGAGSKVIWANNPFTTANGMNGILDVLGIETGEQLKAIIAYVLQQIEGRAAA